MCQIVITSAHCSERFLLFCSPYLAQYFHCMTITSLYSLSLWGGYAKNALADDKYASLQEKTCCTTILSKVATPSKDLLFPLAVTAISLFTITLSTNNFHTFFRTISLVFVSFDILIVLLQLPKKHFSILDSTNSHCFFRGEYVQAWGYWTNKLGHSNECCSRGPTL